MAASEAGADKELCDALYASCATHPAEKLFAQEDLLSLNVIPNGNVEMLALCINQLLTDGLFKLMQSNGKPCWKVVKREDAAKYRSLSLEEAVVFSYIESAGREGIWTRTIRNRSNLHAAVFNRCIKSLESKSLVKAIQSAKFAKRKIFILSHLQPSEDVTGGPFFTDGTLDEEFVFQLGNWVERYVYGRSWYHPSRSTVKKEKGEVASEEAEALKRRAFKENPHSKHGTVLPMPPGYKSYPTIPEITKALNSSTLSSVTMKESEVRQVMDLLCWDARVMKIGNGFRSVRRGSDAGIENGLTEAPCGRCPVFDLCEEGGPVNASNCTYFQDWLND